jgi:hypothetical protein
MMMPALGARSINEARGARRRCAGARERTLGCRCPFQFEVHLFERLELKIFKKNSKTAQYKSCREDIHLQFSQRLTYFEHWLEHELLMNLLIFMAPRNNESRFDLQI